MLRITAFNKTGKALASEKWQPTKLPSPTTSHCRQFIHDRFQAFELAGKPSAYTFVVTSATWDLPVLIPAEK